jgi:hypothetical protein
MAHRGPTIADAAGSLIRERGPMLHEELVRELVAAGRTRAKDPDRSVTTALDLHAGYVRAADGRWYSLEDQLEGAIFSVRLTRLERRHGVVLVRDWLCLIERLALRDRPFALGGDIHLGFVGEFFHLPWPDELERAGDIRDVLGGSLTEDLLGFLDELGMGTPRNPASALVDLAWELHGSRLFDGPPGWIPALGPRDLLGFQVRSGVLDTVRLPRSAVSGPHVEAAGRRLAQLARSVIGPDPSADAPLVVAIEELLDLAAVDSPDLFRRPLPPLVEVIERGGLEVEDGLIGHPGTDWNGLGLDLGLEPGWDPDPDATWHPGPDARVH